jgi:uncharacterized membrane protein (UPF0127 family)
MMVFNIAVLKNLRCLSVRRVAVGLLTASAFYFPAHAEDAKPVLGEQTLACVEGRVTAYGTFGQAQFSIELADTPEERARGLMFREAMGPFEGMLFVYERPQSVHFWMKNTLIPLDMIFTDQTGRIASIHHNAIPHDLTAIFGGDEIFAVLEINAGMSSRLGLKIGDVLQHPAYGASAIQKCSVKNDG